MAHEILSVKLYELDKKLGQVHSRIRISESASPAQIRAEAEALRNECRENELTLRNRLQFSKAGSVSKLAEAYSEVEQIVQNAKARRLEIGRTSFPLKKRYCLRNMRWISLCRPQIARC